MLIRPKENLLRHYKVGEQQIGLMHSVGCYRVESGKGVDQRFEVSLRGVQNLSLVLWSGKKTKEGGLMSNAGR